MDEILAGGVGTLPLAPISSVRRAEITGVLRQMELRFATETVPAEAATL